MYLRPFEVQGNTTNLTVTGTSQTVQVSPVGNRTVRIANNGSQIIYIAFGNSTVTTTTTTGVPIFPSTAETFFIRNENTYIAAIAAAVGSTMYVTVGEGV